MYESRRIQYRAVMMYPRQHCHPTPELHKTKDTHTQWNGRNYASKAHENPLHNTQRTQGTLQLSNRVTILYFEPPCVRQWAWPRARMSMSALVYVCTYVCVGDCVCPSRRGGSQALEPPPAPLVSPASQGPCFAFLVITSERARRGVPNRGALRRPS